MTGSKFFPSQIVTDRETGNMGVIAACFGEFCTVRWWSTLYASATHEQYLSSWDIEEWV